MTHVGVLKYLGELNTPVNHITGTCMGGIVAAGGNQALYIYFGRTFFE